MNTAPVIELSSLANAGPFILLDVRESAAFEAAHCEGAVRVPVEIWEAAAKADETSLENVGYWASEIGKLGVTQDLLAVVYDDGRMTEAARVSHVQAYYLSFADWARDEACSVVR